MLIYYTVIPNRNAVEMRNLAPSLTHDADVWPGPPEAETLGLICKPPTGLRAQPARASQLSTGVQPRAGQREVIPSNMQCAAPGSRDEPLSASCEIAATALGSPATTTERSGEEEEEIKSRLRELGYFQ